MRILTCLRMLAALLCVAALQGCPFGDPAPAASGPTPTTPSSADVRAASNGLHLVVSGSGLTPQKGNHYTYVLGNGGNPTNALVVKALFKGKMISQQIDVLSSSPNIVNVENNELLIARAPGVARVTATHAGAEATITISVMNPSDAPHPQSARYRVTKAALWDDDGPTGAIRTDNFECGNGGMVESPTLWVSIVDQSGQPVTGFDCGAFTGLVTPDVVPSGWPADHRGMRGVVQFSETSGSYGKGRNKGPGSACAFDLPSTGFPIIGSGIKRFKLHIHTTCAVIDTIDGCGQEGFPCEPMLLGKACGVPLTGGSIDFGVQMQSMDDKTWCD